MSKVSDPTGSAAEGSSKRSSMARGILAVLLSVLIGAFAALIGINQYAVGSQDLLTRTQERKERFEKVFGDVSKARLSALSLATQIVAQDQEIVGLFERKDRPGMAAKTVPFYSNVLRPHYNITQFDFFTPPATTFFRAHKPELYGDDHSAVRKMLVKAHQDRTPTMGVEIGTSGPGLRSVVPILRNGELLGSVELGGDIAEPLTAARAATDLDYGFAVDRALSESLGRIYNPLSDVLMGKEMFFRFSAPEVATQMRTLTFDAQSDKPALVTGGDPQTGIRQVFVATLAVNDFAGGEIGRIAVLRDLTTPLRDLRIRIILVTSVSALVLIALTLFALFKFRNLQEGFERSFLSRTQEFKKKADAYDALQKKMCDLQLWKRSFLTAVCSAFHRPLGAAVGSLHAVLQEMEREGRATEGKGRAQAEQLGYIAAELDQISRTLSDYREVLALRDGLVATEIKDVPLAALLREVQATPSGSEPTALHPWAVLLRPELLKVRGDPEGMMRAFQQIQSFVLCQGRAAEVELSAEDAGDGMVRGTIRSAVFAVSPEIADLLFRDIDQFMKRLGEEGGGSLPKGASDLALAARLIAQSGGDLELVAADAGGPALRFVLPLGGGR